MVVAALIIGTVKTAGHLCLCGPIERCPSHAVQPSHLSWNLWGLRIRPPIMVQRREHDVDHPTNASVDTLNLEDMRSPPPAYTHPPNYRPSTLSPDHIERGIAWWKTYPLCAVDCYFFPFSLSLAFPGIYNYSLIVHFFYKLLHITYLLLLILRVSDTNKW